MKKYPYAILALSAAGAVLSALLMLVHYYPESSLSAAACSGGMPHSCSAVSNLPFSSMFGIPLSAYGLLFYLLICFMILIADYAGDVYNEFAAALILPAAVFASILDIFLAGVLVYESEFCSLCAATYAVNFATAALAFFWIKNLCAEKNTGIKDLYKSFIKELNLDSSDRRAAKSLMVLFTAMLAFSVISTDRTMNIKTAGTRASNEEVSKFVQGFYNSPAENLNLPDSRTIFGDPKAPVKIIVFSDYLCSACYKFYTIEKTLLKKYRGKIQFVYYNYPLDKDCNSTMTNTMYQNSCTAASAAVAAAKYGILEDYITVHFNGYAAYKGNKFLAATALANFDIMKTNAVSRNDFNAAIQSKEIKDEIESHVQASRQLKIEATPTFFIASRRLVGIPPVEFIEALIKKELKE